MKLLVDMDVIAYRAAFAAQKTKYYLEAGSWSANYDDAKAAKEAQIKADYPGSVIWSRKEVQPEDTAITIANVMVNDIGAHYAAENPTVIGYFSGTGNYRHSIATRANYKSGRGEPPVHLKAVRNALLSQWQCVLSHGEEADDVIYREAIADLGSCIICSPDKDFRQIACRIYDPVKKEEVSISKKEATINFYSQVISGDPVDSIPGATGYGPIKAQKALAGCKSPWECWQIALGIYVKEWGDITGPLYALECARLVKLGQTKDNLWEPPARPEHLRSSKSSGSKQKLATAAGYGKEQERSSGTA